MNRLLHIVFVALLSSILVSSAVLIFPAYHKNKSLTNQKFETKKKLMEKQLEYNKLRQSFNNITTKTDEVEKIAREKFNLCKEQEIVYKFDGSESK